MPQPLPIDGVLPQVVDALRSSACVVLRAPTGAGKTTRVPPAVLDAGLAGSKQVVMLEPRRIAARAAARRMAQERDGGRGVELGGEVGFHVRFDRVASARTKILVVTEGLLVRMLQDDPFLERVGVLVFDEFHERNLDTDLALALARKVQLEARPDLKLVVMSATIATKRVAEWLGGAAVVESEGRLHPVMIEHLEREEDRPVPLQVAAGVQRVLGSTRGDVLAFLPGVGEIKRTSDELAGFAQRNGLALHELYGDLPPEEQDAVLRRGSRRKIVLATNVAETSVTIDGVTAVVDSGLARVMRFDPGVGLDRLELERISRASADQRAGRAGRTEPGVALRLWTAAAQRSLDEDTDPEIRRVDLAGPVLQLLSFGERDVRAFPWFEAPAEAALEQALELLARLGALDARGLTDVGRALARVPSHPRIARLLLEGARRDCASWCAVAGALLSERDPFLRAPRRGVLQAGRGANKHHSDSDLLDRVVALEDFEHNGARNSLVGELNASAARFVLRAADQLARESERAFRRGTRSATGGGAGSSSADSMGSTGSTSSTGWTGAAGSAGATGSKGASGQGPEEPSKHDVRPIKPGNDATSARSKDDTRLRGDVAKRAGESIELSATAEEDFLRCVLAAWPDRVARRRAEGDRRAVMLGGRGVRLADESAVMDHELFVCAELDGGRRGERAEATVRLASAIERDWLARDRVRVADEVAFDKEKERVFAVRRTYFEDLVLEEAPTGQIDDAAAGEALAEAAGTDLARLIPLSDAKLANFLARVRSLASWMPDAELPRFDDAWLRAHLGELLHGCRSFDDARKRNWIELLKQQLDWKEQQLLEKEAPERLQVPSGSWITLDYAEGRAPALAVRIQEVFGLADTPRIAGGRVKVVLHLLAPNYRPQQVTEDLASFWNGAYQDVRKELRARYPKHSWPDDPWNAPAVRKGPSRRT
ncbi:MAG: DEAD/DEAH box helicase [Planctomycetes bacterium]|nr:DEAD/DEAH box helicase [Planctomycetota bacterium]